MSLSLIGIIFVQGYWIKSTVDDKEEQFTYDVKQVLLRVASEIQNQEIEDYWMKFKDADSTNSRLESSTITEYSYVNQNKLRNQTLFHSDAILEEDYKVSSGFIESAKNSNPFTKFLN